MGNISEHLPADSPIVAAIYDWHKRTNDAEPKRGYLGASIIGHSCDRYLWYNFRQCCKPEFSGQLYRLFETGDLAELRFVKELRAIGCTVHEANEDGSQFAVEAIGGHFSGHMDGAALKIPGAEKTWHVLEFKTHSKKNFAKLKKDIQKSYPKHYAQMLVYMGLTGMKRGLYLAVNKDTDELYAERIHFDKQYFDDTMERAERIIMAGSPPQRAFPRQDYFECKWCDANAICWGSSESALPIPSISCRQCCHATPTMDGNATWKCERHKRGLSATCQDSACGDHLVLPGLISFAEPVDHGTHDSGEMWIDFAGEGGEIWRHGRSTSEFSTPELCKLPASMVNSNSFVKQVKDKFKASIDAYAPDNIIDRYPEEDSEIMWKGAACDLVGAWKDTFCEDMSHLEPVATFKGIDHEAAEFKLSGDSGCVVIKWLKTGVGEIRKGKE